MAEKFTFDPEGCFVQPSDLPVPERELDKLIGREEHVRILMGAMPFFDDDGMSWEFRMEGIDPSAVCPSRAFLFTGAEGCGKRTLNHAFLRRLYDDCRVEDTELRYYEIPLRLMKAETKAESLQRLDTVMSAILEMCRKPEYEEAFLFLSFGNLKPVLKKKAYAERFADWISRLLADESRMSISTGWCHRNPASLPVCIQRAFRVLHLPHPTTDDRSSFFRMMMSPYPNLVWEKQPDELAELTEGFTFRMLNEASQMFYSWIMTGLQEAKLQPGPYITGIEVEKPFVIPMRVCDLILDNVRSKQIIPRQKHQQAPYALPVPMQVPAQAAAMPAAAQVQQQAVPADNSANEETGESRRGSVYKMNTHSELINYAKNLHPIAVLQITASKHNTESDQEIMDAADEETDQRVLASQS